MQEKFVLHPESCKYIKSW